MAKKSKKGEITESEKVTAGWPIPKELKRSFTEFCARVGSFAQEDCAGALLAWQYIDADTREWARLHAKGELGDEKIPKDFKLTPRPSSETPQVSPEMDAHIQELIEAHLRGMTEELETDRHEIQRNQRSKKHPPASKTPNAG